MKTVFSLLVAAAAVAQNDFSDDHLTLIQLRNAKHPKHDHQSHEEALLNAGKIRTGGAQEEADQAQQDADAALDAANAALNTGFQAEDDAQAAQQDAAAEAAGAAAPNAGQENEAAAVGDPHLKLSNGKKADLCCNGGHCKPCDASLFQHDRVQDEGKMGGAQVGVAQQEADQASQEADDAANQADTAMQQAQDAEAEAQQAQADATAEAANPGVQAEAEAVGDPHMKLANGKKADLCCDGHLCKKCPDSTLLQHDKKKGKGKVSDAMADAQAAEASAQEAQAVAQQAQDEAQTAQQQAQDAQDAVANAAAAVAVDPDNQEEAAAVGDPHLTLKTGEKKSLCCKGKHCKPC